MLVLVAKARSSVWLFLVIDLTVIGTLAPTILLECLLMSFMVYMHALTHAHISLIKAYMIHYTKLILLCSRLISSSFFLPILLHTFATSPKKNPGNSSPALVRIWGRRRARSCHYGIEAGHDCGERAGAHSGA